eukprot:SAG11_NODE_2448_length_3349_cov_1.648000_1_plen_438_part_00
MAATWVRRRRALAPPVSMSSLDSLVAWPARRVLASGAPPLNGLSRLLFYALMLGSVNRVCPWRAPELVQQKHQLARPQGMLTAFLPLRFALAPATLGAVRLVGRVAFVFAALGCGGRLPVYLAALGWCWLSNALACVSPNYKKFLVPSWTLLALCLADGRAELSVDALVVSSQTNGDGSSWLAVALPMLRPPTEDSILRTALGPALAYYQLCWSLMGAGVSKLRRDARGGGLFGAGWALRLGEIVEANSWRTKGGARWPWLKRLLVSPQWRHLAVFLAFGALLLELTPLASVLLLTGEWAALLRPLLLLMMIGLHFGIAATMPPIFYHQALCYLVMADSAHVCRCLLWPVLSRGSVTDWEAAGPPDHAMLHGHAMVATNIVVWLLTAVLCVSTTLRPIEWFPLSEFAFYASPPSKLAKSGRVQQLQAALAGNRATAQ